MTDQYYNSILPNKYNPDTWWGDEYQENAGFEEMYNRINALNPNLVIDAGCGRNKHKNHIKNLIGFDASPYPEVDLHCAILDAPFDPNSADAVLALGSVQFISKEYIIENVERIVSWVKPGGLIEIRILLQDKVAKNYIEEYDKKGVKVSWDTELKNYVSKKYNLSYFIKPWIYNGTASIDVIEKISLNKKRAIAKQNLKRECWTWIKN